MSKTTNTIAAIATAAAVGTGVYLTTDTAEESAVSQIVWEIPTLELPTLDLPTLDVAEIAIPTIDLVSFEVPSINSEVSAAEKTLTDVDMFDDVKIDVAELQLKLPDFIGDAEKVETLRKLAIDQRNIEYSRHTFGAEWQKIYEQYANVEPVKFIPLKSGFRMITEVRMPEKQSDLNNLSKHLNFYKSKGCNAALVCFRNGDDPQEMAQLIRYIKGHGLYVFFAFGGPENLNDEIYSNPRWFKEMLIRCARESHGFMPWRRSSLHLFVPDKAWNNFVHHTIREANPEIYILGEIYYGMTALEHPKIKWWFNIPENCSGVMLKNLGYRRFNLENIIKLARENGNIPDLPIITTIHGEHPYYATRRKNNRTFLQNLDIKFQLEKRFLKAGACGSIIFHDDGSDGMYDKKVVNNLTAAEFSAE